MSGPSLVVASHFDVMLFASPSTVCSVCPVDMFRLGLLRFVAYLCVKRMYGVGEGA